MAAATATLRAMKSLQGADRVAAILLTMEKSLAARLMKHFEPDEIRRVTRSAADLRPVAAPQLRQLIEDFATQFAGGANLVGTAGEVERMLDGVLPREQIDEIMTDIMGNADRSIWERISSVNEVSLAAYLVKEHPQTAALILSKVKADCAAKIIGHLPAGKRDGIIRRMIAVRPVSDDVMRMLERVLHDEFTTNFSRNSESEGQQRLAEIINKLDRDQMDQVLESLATTRPKAAESLKSMLFTFDDLTKLTVKARGGLFDKVPNDLLVLALKGTPTEFREAVLSSLSSRVRKMIEQELNNGQPVAQREVLNARRTITDLAVTMANRGEIEIRSDGEETYIT